LIIEKFPANTFLQLPTVEARTEFLDGMYNELETVCRSIEDIRGRIREAQEEEERKKRKLEDYGRRLAGRFGGSNPELMDFEASAPNSPRGELACATFPLTLPRSQRGKHDENVLLAVGLACVTGTRVTSLSWNFKEFLEHIASIPGAELGYLKFRGMWVTVLIKFLK
jgi:hypothetical protein